MKIKVDQISQILKEFIGHAEQKNIKAFIVANEDGLPITSNVIPYNKELEFHLSAVSSTLMNTGENIAARLQMGFPKTILVEMPMGILMVTNLRKNACCGIVIDHQLDIITQYKKELKEITNKIDQILFD